MVTIRYIKQPNLLVKTVLPLSAFCALLYFWLVQPLQDQLEEIRSHSPTLKLLLASREQEQSRLADSCAFLEERQRQLHELLAPLGTKPIKVLQALLELASDNQTDIKWHSPRNKNTSRSQDKSEDLSYQFFSVELKGQYNNLREYLEGVCHLNHVLQIDHFEI
ncbi:MAG: hypothetical protein ACWGQW_14645, partial [bacterium]